MKKILIAVFTLAICSALCLTACAEGTDATEYKSIFDMAADFVTANCAEILSLLTFVGSLILALTYKNGLLPKLSGALKGIGGSVGELTESTERSIRSIGESIDEVKRVSEGCRTCCNDMSERIDTLDDSLRALKSDGDASERVRLIIEAQIDMLYDVFMSSTLPQYSKDAVHERISSMRKTLLESEKCDE